MEICLGNLVPQFNILENLLTRITCNPNIGHGKPSIRDTRHSVEAILEYLAGGDSVEEVIGEFPELTREDILACIAFATACIKSKFGLAGI